MPLELHVQNWRGPNSFTMSGISTLIAQGYEIRIIENNVYKGKFTKANNPWGYTFLKGALSGQSEG